MKAKKFSWVARDGRFSWAANPQEPPENAPAAVLDASCGAIKRRRRHVAKTFLSVGPRWSFADLERLTCGADRSHCHLSARRRLRPREASGDSLDCGARRKNVFIPNDRPTVDQRHGGGILRICKIFAIRGTSSLLGEYLAAAVRKRESWALAFLEQVRGKLAGQVHHDHFDGEQNRQEPNDNPA